MKSAIHPFVDGQSAISRILAGLAHVKPWPLIIAWLLLDTASNYMNTEQ